MQDQWFVLIVEPKIALWAQFHIHILIDLIKVARLLLGKTKNLLLEVLHSQFSRKNLVPFVNQRKIIF